MNIKVSSIPNSVFKFYALKDYNIDAFIDHYLYLNHPSQLNDGMDACNDFLYMGNIKTESSYKNIIEHIRQRVPQLINHKLTFNTDKECNKLKDILYKSYFDFRGSVSFTKDINSVFNSAMWAYYTEEKGFAIEFQTDLLINGIENEFGNQEFQITAQEITYVDNLNNLDYTNGLEAIDCNSINNIEEMDTRVVFQKQAYWEHEEEWRLFAKSKHYLGLDYERYLLYPTNAIKRIYLGNKFWEEICSNIDTDFKRYTVKEEYLSLILKLQELEKKVYSSSKCYSPEISHETNGKSNEKYHPIRSFNPIEISNINKNEFAISFFSDSISQYREFSD